MKKITTALAMLALTAGMQAQQVVVYRADGTQVKLHYAEIDSISFFADTWQDPTGEPNRLPMSFIATSEGHDPNGPMRVHVGTGSSNNKEMLWTAGDSVVVLQGQAHNKFKLTQGADTRSGTFSGTAAAGSCTVVYPYQNHMVLSGSTMTSLVLPTLQHATDGSCWSRAALMIAQGDLSAGQTVALGFRNICSYLAITPTQNLDRVEVSALSRTDNLSGLINVNYNDGAPTWAINQGQNKVTLLGPLTAGHTYYIAVLPGALTQGFRMASYTTDGKVITKKVSTAATFSRSQYHDCTGMTSGTKKDYIVDMGLEGRARYWSNRNIGAASVTDFGDYFAWGESYPVFAWNTNRAGHGNILKTDCTWVGYKYFDHSSSSEPDGLADVTKYNSEDHHTALDAADDAAKALWGEGWQMPSKADFEALLTCPHEYTTDYKGTGTRGFIFYHKAYSGMTDDGQLDNETVTHLFLPFGGYYNTSIVNPNTDLGSYWSKDVDSREARFSKAYRLVISKNESEVSAVVNSDYRRSGQNIRPVYVGTLPQQ